MNNLAWVFTNYGYLQTQRVLGVLQDSQHQCALYFILSRIQYLKPDSPPTLQEFCYYSCKKQNQNDIKICSPVGQLLQKGKSHQSQALFLNTSYSSVKLMSDPKMLLPIISLGVSHLDLQFFLMGLDRERFHKEFNYI